MPAGHVVLAVLVATVWGVNFVVVELALDSFPPLLLAVLRFTLVALPAVAFVRRPRIDTRWLVGVGLFLCAGQFGLLFVAMAQGMPAGLASLVMQLQAVFTIGLGVTILGERPRAMQSAGAAMTVAGIVVMAGGRDTAVPLVAMVLCVAAAASWAVGNLCTRRAQATDPVALLVWSSLVPPVPLLALALVFEGPRAMAQAMTSVDAAGVAALLYVVGVSTFAGFGLWAWLLQRHAMTSLAPYTLLVPVAGIAAAWLALGERPAQADLVGAGVVLLGLLLAARAGVSRKIVYEPGG